MYAADFTEWLAGYILHWLIINLIVCAIVLIVSKWHEVGWMLLSALVIKIVFANYKD